MIRLCLPLRTLLARRYSKLQRIYIYIYMYTYIHTHIHTTYARVAAGRRAFASHGRAAVTNSNNSNNSNNSYSNSCYIVIIVIIVIVIVVI